MAPQDPDAPPSPLAWHRLLLRLAGRLPDDVVSEARSRVAQGQLVAAARGVADAAVAGGVPMAEADAGLVARTLRAAGTVPAGLATLDRRAAEQPPPFTMAPASAAVLSEHRDGFPACLDLTGGHAGPAGPDDVDRAAIAAAGREADAIGLWRAWRLPTGQRRPSAAKRIHLLTVRPGRAGAARMPAIADRLRAALATAGEASPQVEVVAEGDDLPGYQRMARGCGALLWASSERPDIRIARVFDRVDARTGPRFEPGHARITDPGERERVAAHLRGGALLLHTTALMDDVVDRARTGRVPMSFRTDGRWIWTDTVHYYLAEHGLAPDAELLAHLRRRGSEIAAPDSVALHRAMAVLQAPRPAPVWSTR